MGGFVTDPASGAAGQLLRARWALAARGATDRENRSPVRTPPVCGFRLSIPYNPTDGGIAGVSEICDGRAATQLRSKGI